MLFAAGKKMEEFFFDRPLITYHCILFLFTQHYGRGQRRYGLDKSPAYGDFYTKTASIL
jgi:hypothetical protein